MARSRTIVELNGEEIARRNPEQFTVEREMRKRSPERVYLDWGQVGRGMTIVPPYAARACDGAPISMPLHWREIERLALYARRSRPSCTSGATTSRG